MGSEAAASLDFYDATFGIHIAREQATDINQSYHIWVCEVVASHGAFATYLCVSPYRHVT